MSTTTAVAKWMPKAVAAGPPCATSTGRRIAS